MLSTRVHTRPVRIVGKHIVLKLDYHEDQEWFPFMDGTLLSYVPPLPDLAVPPKKIYHPMYPAPERGVQQYVLPFVMFKRITNAQMEQMKEAKFPSFELTVRGAPYNITHKLKRRPNPEEEQWCRDTFAGRYFANKDYFLLEKADDAIVCKLRFG